MRREPPRSVPSARAIIPQARAAAPPPVEPPALSAGFQGLRVRPNTSLKVLPPVANSGVLVLPMMMAPAARSRCTTRASSVGTLSRYSGEPYVVRTPATGVTSLIPTGSPQSRPGASPAASRFSSARASSSARSDKVQTALIVPLWRSICARAASATSTGETSRRAIRSRNSVAGRRDRVS